MKLLNVKSLNKAIKSLRNGQAEVTLSLAYYGLIFGNVSPLKGEAQDVVTALHKDYKALIPATFSKKDKEWVYNSTKAKDLAKKFKLKYQETTWEEFLDLVCQVRGKAEVIRTDVEERDLAIKRCEKALDNAITKGVDIDALIILLKSKKAAQ